MIDACPFCIILPRKKVKKMAILLNGKELREKKLELLKEKVSRLEQPLGLVVISVGEDEASKVYVNNKGKLAKKLGYNFIHESLDESITEQELIQRIYHYNQNEEMDGIIVQMPLPKNMDASRVQNAILPEKDVDGLTYINQGKLMQNKEALIPCTPKGILDLLKEYQIPIEGANVAIIGRSILVGKPLSVLLTNHNATVSLLHSKTRNLEEYTRKADIVVAAVGKKHFVTEDMVKEGSVIIDVGINRENGKLYGDVDFDHVKEKASYITPVPGGVGPMTVYELMDNVYQARILKREKN